MACCTSAPPTSAMCGSAENTGHACSATKQICGNVFPATSSAFASRPIVATGILSRGPACRQAVHQTDRDPKIGRLGVRGQAAADKAGEEKRRQRRACPLEKPAHLG